MIYKITFMNDEVDSFKRTFLASSDATFFDLHSAILESVGYPDDQMTSFFMCNDRWEKEQEVTLVEMGQSFEYDNITMAETHLDDLLTEPKQRLIYIFDPMYERYFFGSLTSIEPGNMDGVKCTEKKGNAPKQLQTEDPVAATRSAAEMDLGEDFYGDSAYDIDDIDQEGFQDLSFEDGSMF